MNIDNKFLLVCLQLIIALLMSMKVEGREQRGNERAYRLFNQCALRYVLVQGNISASANESDVRGDLVLETRIVENELRIQIRGHVSDDYLCFNRRGKLVAKSKTRGLLCDFMEVPSEHSWSYRSVHNPSWLLGFDPKGRPLRGLAHLLPRRPKDCFRFNKVGRYVDPTHFNVDSHNNHIGQTPPPQRPRNRRPHSPRHQLQQPTTTTTTTTTPAPPPRRHPLRHHGKSGARRPPLNSLGSRRKKSQGWGTSSSPTHPVNIPTKKRR